ncbi:MAG: hypothetical protein JW708_10535, partial [Vallitaleaceae bacterium]|nr:hypothetical protein [Vallitaleaceae bacterium]
MKGSISIFFACIMLCLITFSVSILDVSRINNFQIIASNNLLTASKIALSQYDPLLFNEYGIFAGEKGEHIQQVLDTALQGMYYPEKSQNTEFLLDYVEEEAKKKENQSAPLNYYHPQSYELDIKYYPFFYDGVDGIKKQMTNYMKIQLPFIAVEGIAEKFNLLSKGSKSSKWIEEKNLMIEKLGTLSELKKELFSLTDGIV